MPSVRTQPLNSYRFPIASEMGVELTQASFESPASTRSDLRPARWMEESIVATPRTAVHWLSGPSKEA